MYNVALFHTMNLSERVYLITGGASGLGEAAVRRLHSRGAAVSILDRSEERAKVRLYKFNIPIFLLGKVLATLSTLSTNALGGGKRAFL